MNSKLHKACAETIGVFFLVLFGCGSIRLASNQAFSMALVPLIFGLVIMVLIYALGHISGAHFNPAVTLAFTLTKRFPKEEFLLYCLAQCLGALGACWVLSFALPSVNPVFGATVPQLSLLQTLLWEGLLSFILMFVIMAVATDSRAVGTMAGIAIGGAVALCAFVGGPLTGASMNPARSFGPALFEGQLAILWLYILGPCLGATAAALCYEWIRCDQSASKTPIKGCC